MPQPYLRPRIEVNINRSVYGGFRDDNFNVGWTLTSGGSFTTNGDVGTLRSSPTFGVGKAQKTVPGTLSTTTWPWLIWRSKATNDTPIIRIHYTDTTEQTDSHTNPNFTARNLPLTTGKTVQWVQLENTNPGNAAITDWDYVCIAKNSGIKFTTQDVDPISATRATSSADEFSFNLRNNGGFYYTGANTINLGDDVYIYHGNLKDDTVTPSLSRVFGGTIEDLTPDLSTNGDILQVHGRGWAAKLLTVLIAKEYGSLSDNNSITTASGAVSDIITTVNGSGIQSGGYQFTTTYLQSFSPTLSYILFKNDPAFNAVKQLADLITANSDPTGTSTNPVEFWVDPAENAHMAPIGNWGTDPNLSSYPNALNVGTEHITNSFRRDIIDMRNQIHYFSATLKPPNGDAWTETGPITDWTIAPTGGAGGTFTTSYDSSAGNFKVNGNSVKGNWTGMSTGTSGILLTYNPAVALAQDITKLGGKITPPKLRFYVKTDVPSTSFPYALQIHMMTDGSNYFQSNYWPTNVNIVTNAGGISGTDWQLFEMKVGPYGDFPPGFVTGSPVWTNINRIRIKFLYSNSYTAGNVWVDGFNIDGQTHWVAKDSTKVIAYGIREAHLVNNRVRDTVTQQLLAKAELYKLHSPVMKGSIRVPGISAVLPGQKVTMTAPSANLSAASLRVLEVRHRFGSQEGYTTELDLTDDLTNYQTLEPTRLSNVILELHTPPFKKKEEQDVYMGTPDPTTIATTIDYPS
jgi:hypothetical protein